MRRPGGVFIQGLIQMLGWLTSGIVDGIPTDILKDFPEIARVCSAVDAHTKIQEWVSQTYPKAYIRGNYLCSSQIAL